MTPPGVTGRGLFLHSTSYAKGSSSLAGTLRGPAGVGTMTRQLGRSR